MKQWMLCWLMCVWVVSAHAEEAKLVLHLNEKEKAATLINMVNNYRAVEPNADIVVVVNSSGVIRLKRSGGLKQEIMLLLERGVEVGVCNNAIVENKVNPEVLIPGVTLLKEGAVARLVELQKQGYIYIKI